MRFLDRLYSLNPFSKPPPKTPPTTLPFLHWINIYIHHFSALCQWHNVFDSSIALITLHVFYFLISHISISPLSLLSWISLLCFTQYTWKIRIWRAISVRPVSAVNMSNDVQRIMDRFESVFQSLVRIRTNSPSFFMFSSLTVLFILAYIGTFLSGFLLLYLVNMFCFTVPVLMERFYAKGGCGMREEEHFDLPNDSLESFDVLEADSDLFKDDVTLFSLPAFPSHEEDEDSSDDFFPSFLNKSTI